jgi:integrase/recombinase XerD
LVPTKRLTPTVIRQSVIAGRLKSGQGLRQVQAFAGHKKISATERYRENNLEALRLAVEKFHPLSATE